MEAFDKLIQKQKIWLNEVYYINDFITRIYLEKTYSKATLQNQYFLKLIKIDPKGLEECLGYIYFNIDEINNNSKFIGIYIKPEFRNTGLASLLVANWIKLCIDNDIEYLTTTGKQRKPALLHLLKNYTFEIDNPEIYESSPYTISICEGIYDKQKYLYFKAEKLKKEFIESSIMEEGNYYILDELTQNYRIIDNILTSQTYTLQDKNESYTRALKKIDTTKN